MVGSLWLSQPYNAAENDSFNSSGNYRDKDTVQRGSLALANTVAETDFQGPVSATDLLPKGNLNNCFSCHTFSNNDTEQALPMYFSSEGSLEYIPGSAGKLSHIMSDIIQGSCTIELVSLKSDNREPYEISEACPELCESRGAAWTGVVDVQSIRGGELPMSLSKCNCCIQKQ